MKIAAHLFRAYRKSINPPYTRKDAMTILATLFILVAIPLTVFSVLTTRNWQPKAAPTSFPPRGVEGDLWADVVIGKPDFSEINPYTTVSNKLFVPFGVFVDRTGSFQKLYVYDSGNNRILGLKWNDCLASGTNPANCSAYLVLGQPNMSTSACNGDSGFQNFPIRAPASASSLCTLPEYQPSLGEGGSGASMAVDSQGDLFVTDFFSNRVLKYNQPFSTDTTNGKGDSIADAVWGQDDFSGNACNKGQASPDNTSLCLGGARNGGTAGVDIDASGNLWVTDSSNHRVLRFSNKVGCGGICKTADLVLGQSDFSQNTNGSGLNQLDSPSAVRIDNGWVYVADTLNNRVLVFKPAPTLTDGMYGVTFGSGFSYPKGIDLDPTESGHLWITSHNNRTVELWKEDTQTKERVIGRTGDGNILGQVSGSVGVDLAGNVLAATGTRGNYPMDVLLFLKSAAVAYPAEQSTPSKQIFGGGAGNSITTSGLGAARGVVIASGQLIVADLERLMYWNDPASLSNQDNGKAADGVAGKTTDATGRSYGCCWVMKADKRGNLYVAVDGYGGIPRHIDVFQLPLSPSEQPYKTITFPILILNGGQISSSSSWGLAPADDSSFLWVTDSDNSRVFRIRDPLDLDPTQPTVVDVILGQTDTTGTQCNRGLGAPPTFYGTADSLCYPGSLSLDRLGNLYVSDQSLEIRGNSRLLEFNKNLFPTNNAAVIYTKDAPASKIFPDIATWEPAFNSLNQMVVGYNGYGPNPGKAVRFPGVYPDPLGATTTPKSFLNDFYSIPFTATFDDSDNLYVGDGSRSRVLIYKKPNLNYACPASFPNDKFHACFYHTTDPATGPLIGERDEGAVSSPAPANATPINHDYGGGGEYGENDNFSGVWRGDINFPAGTYKFKVTVDNGVRLDIGDDGTYEIDDWTNGPPRTLYSNPITLNGYTRVRLEWFEGANLASVVFGWEFQGGPGPKTGDLNGDSKVDAADLKTLLDNWGPTSGTVPADINKDSIVNIFDLSILLSNWES